MTKIPRIQKHPCPSVLSRVNSTTLLLLLQLVDLLHPPLMSAALEVGLHPNLDDPFDTLHAPHVARQATHVWSVMPPAQLRRYFVLARRSPHVRKLVGRDRHPDPGAADENAPLDLAAAHLLRDQGREVRIVNGRVARRTIVDDLMPFRLKERNHLLLKMKSPMITSNGNFHDKPIG